MSFFKVKVGEKVYQLDRLTLGDGYVLERDFGIDPENITINIGSVIGLLTLAISKTDGIPIAEARKVAEDVDFEDFQGVGDEDGDAAKAEDPTKGGDADAATAARAKSGSSGKRRNKPGTRN